MLRIERADGGDSRTMPTLRVEGKLVGPWVSELSRACEELRVSPDRLRIDLSALTFVDPAGLALLRGLAGRGTVISGCSAFIEELLSEDEARR